MKKTLFALLLIVCCSIRSEAQSMSNQERRYVNSKVLSVVDEYERYLTVYDEEAEYCFLGLFTTPEASVICDVIGLSSYLKPVSVTEYVRMMRSVTGTANIVISDLRKGEMLYSSQGWVIPVSFKKNISYIDGNGCAFSVRDFYGNEMDMSMTLIYDPNSDTCKIESINGEITSDKKFPEGRFIIVNKPDESKMSAKYVKLADEMTVNGNHLVYNEFGQAFLASGKPSVDDVDVVVLTDTVARGQNYDMVNYSFKSRNARLKFRYGLAPFSAYNVKSSSDVISRSNAMEFGVDIGATWASGKSAKMGIFIGAGLSSSRLSLSLAEQINYGYATSVMGAGGLFNKLNSTFTVKSASERMQFVDIIVPLYFETEHRVGNYVLISWNFGLKAYYNTFVSAEYQVEGNMAMANDVGENIGKKDFSLTSPSYISPASYKRNPMDISAMLNLGVDINLLKRRLYLSIKGGYEYGLNRSYSGKGMRFYDDEANVYPVLYNPLTSEFTAMHSFIGSTSFRRQAFWFDFGFKLKM